MKKANMNNANRRSFLKKMSAATLVIPVVNGISLTSPLLAEALPPADEAGALATSLSYVHDASSSAVRENESALCRNCALYVDNGTEWGGCSIFPSSSVNMNGWCKAWAPK